MDNRGKIVRYLLLTGVVLVLIFGATRIVGRIRGDRINQPEVRGAKASKDINRLFTFPLRNQDGEVVSKIEYEIEKAELRDEIIVKGQKATAVKGRIFLVFTLKVTNKHNQAIEIATRDYIRLSVNGDGEELLAPDIHNDPVEVQAISTKYTRVGFPINDNDKDLTLYIGEIDGSKEQISLEF